MMGNMRLLLTNDNSPAAIGVCNILENLPSRSILSNKHIFVMTGGLPYTEKQHKIITQVITDPSMIVIIIELRSRALSNYHLHLQRDYVYYLDGTISLQAITSHLKNILNSVADEVKITLGHCRNNLLSIELPLPKKRPLWECFLIKVANYMLKHMGSV